MRPIIRQLRVASVALSLIVSVGAASSLSAQSSGVSISLDPPNINLSPGETVAVSVIVDSSGQPIDTVQVYLDFDPTLLQVVDDAGDPALAVAYGPVISDGEWKQPLLNEVDNVNGRIGIAAGKGPPASGAPDLAREFVLAVINFQAIGEASDTRITFDLESQESLQRSKAFFQGSEVTGGALGATVGIGPGDGASAAGPGVSMSQEGTVESQTASGLNSDTASSAGPVPALGVSSNPGPGAAPDDVAPASAGASLDSSSSGFGLALPLAAIGGLVLAGLAALGILVFSRSRQARQS